MHPNHLLVEDDAHLAKLATDWLSRSQKVKSDVRQANSLQQAWLISEAASIGVIQADLDVPTAAAAIQRMRDKKPMVPLVVLSAREAEEVVYQTIVQGAQDFIVKPDCNPESLISKVVFAIARQFEEVGEADCHTRPLAT